MSTSPAQTAEQLSDVFEDACNLSTSWDDFELDYNPCPFGDLVVILSNGNHTTSFLVSSFVLRMASPVWNKSLDPESPFTKDRERESVDVEGRSIPVFQLHEDDPAALLVIFWIIHYRHEEVPQHVTFDQLRSLAMICDKYNCTPAIAPTADPWVQHWAKHALVDGHEDWLFIGPTFGEVTNFQKLTGKLIHGISKRRSQDGDDKKFDLYLMNGLLDTALIPQILLDAILRVRDKVFQFQMNLLVLFSWKLKSASVITDEDSFEFTAKPEFVQKLEENLSAHSYISDMNKELLSISYACKESCISMAYGSFIRSLERLGLEPYVLGDILLLHASREEWNGNLDYLLERLETFSVLTHGKEHAVSCGIEDFEKRLSSLMQPRTLRTSLLPRGFYDKYERKFGEWRTIDISSSS